MKLTDTSTGGPQAHVSYVFRRLSRGLRQLQHDPEAEVVHQFRTTIRRLRVLASSLRANEDRQVARFEKVLARLFARSGKVRDIDVLIMALNTLTLPSIADDKTQLMSLLRRQRARRERKLQNALDEALADGLPRRQRRAKAALVAFAKQLPHGDSAQLHPRAELLPFVTQLSDCRFDEDQLHAFRLEVKRLRYRAEAAGDEGRVVVRVLKPLQDAIGAWHDWYNVYALAQEELKYPAGHPILPVIKAKLAAHLAEVQRAVKKACADISRLVPFEASPQPPAPQRLEIVRAQAAKAS